MLKRIPIILTLLACFWLISPSVLAAGEGNIQMLGFSSDSRFFVLAESVIEDGSGIPSAKMMIANIATNQCVRGGCLSLSGSTENDTEQEVLNKIYRKTWLLRKKLKLTPPQTGYQAKGPFFDNQRNRVYYTHDNQKIYVSMQQEVVPGPYGFHEKAAVQITVNVFDKNNPVTKVLDSTNNYRMDAQSYQLGRLFVSPDKKSIAILVRVFYRGFEGPDIRTLVQTAPLF